MEELFKGRRLLEMWELLKSVLQGFVDRSEDMVGSNNNGCVGLGVKSIHVVLNVGNEMLEMLLELVGM